MKLDTYKQALRYAGYIDWRTHKDVVHDAYVHWYNKTGKDLFDEPPRLATTMVMYAIRRAYSVTRPTFMWRKQFYPNITIPISEEYEEGHYIPRCVVNYDDVIDASISELKLNLVLTIREKDIFSKLVDGYNQTEISEVLEVSPQAIFTSIKNIRLKAIKLSIN